MISPFEFRAASGHQFCLLPANPDIPDDAG
jgi:hypothetical protein